MQELGLAGMALDDAQEWEPGVWRLYYAPTVNGIRVSGVRQDLFRADGTRESYEYEYYNSSEGAKGDMVSWNMENIQIYVGSEGILSFEWYSPSGDAIVQEESASLLPFEEIAAVADTMLPVVITGPSESYTLVELDKLNGFETRMDVTITEVSLTLMRIRDKGSSQGTIVPVWDFWGSWSWYAPGTDISRGYAKRRKLQAAHADAQRRRRHCCQPVIRILIFFISTYSRPRTSKCPGPVCFLLLFYIPDLLKIAAAECFHVAEDLFRVPIPPLELQKIRRELFVEPAADDPAGIAARDCSTAERPSPQRSWRR